MRQSALFLLCLLPVALLAETPAASLQTIADQRVELAQKQLDRLRQLVDAGAVARLQVTAAEQNLADAQDDAVLAGTLYSNIPLKDWTSQMADQMVAAAERRVQRQQDRLAQTQKMVDEGLEAQAALVPLQAELSMRQSKLDMAHAQVQQMNGQAELARLEESIERSTEAEHAEGQPGEGQADVVAGMEHFQGSGHFSESRELKAIEAAFEKKFDRELPISADGETALHRSLGLDHRGRVDVAVAPNSTEGVWLRDYLKTRDIPYYAFTHAMPGKATGAHIHIGPGSTRLSEAAD
ncbi:MAG TPA: hypothetical protein VKX49_02150 [Bryobacteraceae bacterium]|nr:hypothetical protein [Bryobacteraceae bacterium]